MKKFVSGIILGLLLVSFSTAAFAYYDDGGRYERRGGGYSCCGW